MKYKAVMIALLSVSLSVSKSKAENGDNCETELNSRAALAGLLWLPVSYITEMASHELVGHALLAEITGTDVVSVKLLPHKFEGRWRLGTVFFKEEPHPIVRIGPLIINTVWFGIAETLFAADIVGTDSLGAPLLFVGMELAPWIDFTNNLSRFGEDLTKFEKATGAHPMLTRTVGGALVGFGLWKMISRAEDIFFVKTKKQTEKESKESRVNFLPYAVSADAGASLIYRF